MKRISYLCLQATREGQASHAHVHEIIDGLIAQGWEVHLFEPGYADSPKAPTAFARLLQFGYVQMHLWLSAKPDAVYIRWHFASWPTALWARLRGIRVVQEVNGPYEDLFLAWPWTRCLRSLFIRLMRSQLSWADAVIVVTPQLAQWVRTEVGNKDIRLEIIPNGANTKCFHPLAQPDAGVPLPPLYVAFFGALAPWQGVDTMLAATESPDWPSDVSLVILGDGMERAKVERAAEHSSRVCYLGARPYRQVPGIVAGSIAAVSPQVGKRAETGLFPLKVLEALACGVPVIVSDFPGMADLVREGQCGLVIPPEDPEALAKAVAYMFTHPKERALMGDRGRRLIERDHSWARRAEQTAALLERVLNY